VSGLGIDFAVGAYLSVRARADLGQRQRPSQAWHCSADPPVGPELTFLLTCRPHTAAPTPQPPPSPPPPLPPAPDGGFLPPPAAPFVVTVEVSIIVDPSTLQNTSFSELAAAFVGAAAGVSGVSEALVSRTVSMTLSIPIGTDLDALRASSEAALCSGTVAALCTVTISTNARRLSPAKAAASSQAASPALGDAAHDDRRRLSGSTSASLNVHETFEAASAANAPPLATMASVITSSTPGVQVSNYAVTSIELTLRATQQPASTANAADGNVVLTSITSAITANTTLDASALTGSLNVIFPPNPPPASPPPSQPPRLPPPSTPPPQSPHPHLPPHIPPIEPPIQPPHGPPVMAFVFDDSFLGGISAVLVVVVMLILVGVAAMGYKHFHQSKGGKRSDDAVEYMRRQPAGPLQTVARRLNRVAPPAFADASVIEPARARTIRTPTPPSSQGSPRARSVGTPPSLSSDGPTRGGAIRTLAPPSSAEPAHDPRVELTKAAGQPIGINLQAGRSRAVVVHGVAETSSAHGRLNAGDVLLSVNGTAVTNPRTASELILAAGPQVVLMCRRTSTPLSSEGSGRRCTARADSSSRSEVQGPAGMPAGGGVGLARLDDSDKDSEEEQAPLEPWIEARAVSTEDMPCIVTLQSWVRGYRQRQMIRSERMERGERMRGEVAATTIQALARSKFGRVTLTKLMAAKVIQTSLRRRQVRHVD